MEIICYILLACLLIVSDKGSAKQFDLMNVKTVLWKPSSTEDVCWGRNDVLLLYARRVAQDLLPTKIPSDLGQLLQYLDIVWEAASKIKPTSGVSTNDVVRPAIGDAIGGYLQTAALPFATEAYYAGTVDYRIIRDFDKLLSKIKVYLDTDGGGWAAASDLSQMATKVQSINFRNFPAQSDPSSCQKLHIPMIEAPPNPNPQCGNDTLGPQPALDTMVEMPILDDLEFPRAMIVPFKSKHLYSIMSPTSAHVLVEYYDVSMRCIGQSDTTTIKHFNAAYFNWLSTYILPHIQVRSCPTEWFPGFGGVMKVVDTITGNGLTPSSVDHSYGIKPKPPKTDDSSLNPPYTPPKEGDSSSQSSWIPKVKMNQNSLPTLRLYYFLFPLLIPLLGCFLVYVLYLLFTKCCLPLMACLCCKSRSKSRKDRVDQPLMSLYYRCLQSLGGYRSNADENMPDYDSIAAASGVSAKSLSSSNKSEKTPCGMCDWITKKDKSSDSKKNLKKKKKGKKRVGIDSDTST